MGLLEKARAYEAAQKAITDLERPAFHVTGMTGWINDPNGFSTYKGEYHLFFQYHPYSVCWGPMHWGHVKTKDFIRWEHLPAAIAPEMDFEKEVCLSGSAIELEDGRQLLFYTGMAYADNDGYFSLVRSNQKCASGTLTAECKKRALLASLFSAVKFCRNPDGFQKISQ